MALTITGHIIKSPDTTHTAVKVRDGWRVSWLPGRILDQQQAICAMLIAQEAGRGTAKWGEPVWPHVEGWAAILGLVASDAVSRACEPPAGTAR